MSYPTVDQSYKSNRKAMNANKIDIAENGKPRARSFHTSTTYDFTVVHELIASTEMQSILDCYTSAISDTITMVWDGNGETYDVIFKGEPAPKPVPGGLWNVTTVFVGQKS